MLGEDGESELVGLASLHEEHAGDAVRDLTGIATRRRRRTSALCVLGERRADLGEGLLGRAHSNSVIVLDDDADALLAAGGSLPRVDGHDLSGKLARLLGSLSALVRKRGELVHSLAGDVEVAGDVLGRPAHRLEAVLALLVHEQLGREGGWATVGRRRHGLESKREPDVDLASGDLVRDD